MPELNMNSQGLEEREEILLLDLGNTAMKVGYLKNPRRVFSIPYDEDADACPSFYSEALYHVKKAIGSTVCSVEKRTNIEKFLKKRGIEVKWVRTPKEYKSNWELLNGYEKPESLGSDRWLGMIAAVEANTSTSSLVVQLGSATTIDCVGKVSDKEFLFLGGKILPGVEMMKRSLAIGTAKLPYLPGNYEDFPRRTVDGIASGVISAQVGAIKETFNLLKRKTGKVKLFVSGGNASTFTKILTDEIGEENLEFKNNIVIEGLRILANQKL